MDASVLKENSSFKMLGLSFSSKSDWGSYIISIAKTSSKKLEPWFVLWIFFPLKLLYLSINLSCGLAWNAVVMYGLMLLAATWNCYISYKNGYVVMLVLSFAASLESSGHLRNVTSLSLFYRYYFGRCSSEQAQLVPLPYSRGRSTRYSDRTNDFSVTILRCYKDIYVNSFFPHTSKLWSSLPIECFHLTYDPNSFKFRINS